MNRNRIAVLIVALLCVGALAVAAATVDAPRGSGEGVGTGSGTGVGSGEDTGVERPEQEQRPPSAEFPWLPGVAVVVFLLVAAAALWILYKELNAKRLARVVAVLLVVGIVAFAFLGLLNFVPTNDQPQPPQQPEQPRNDPGGGGEASEEEIPDRQFDVPITLLAAFGVVAVVLIGVVARFSGNQESAPVSAGAEPDSEDVEEGVGAVGEAAGRAADRLEGEGGDVENAVYRAWREMTGALSIDRPATTTPAEFADAAVDAGMDAEDVSELTWLFEEVRYGDAAVTSERERRARRALRRIEETYAEAEIERLEGDADRDGSPAVDADGDSGSENGEGERDE